MVETQKRLGVKPGIKWNEQFFMYKFQKPYFRANNWTSQDPMILETPFWDKYLDSPNMKKK